MLHFGALYIGNAVMDCICGYSFLQHRHDTYIVKASPSKDRYNNNKISDCYVSTETATADYRKHLRPGPLEFKSHIVGGQWLASTRLPCVLIQALDRFGNNNNSKSFILIPKFSAISLMSSKTAGQFVGGYSVLFLNTYLCLPTDSTHLDILKILQAFLLI